MLGPQGAEGDWRWSRIQDEARGGQSVGLPSWTAPEQVPWLPLEEPPRQGQIAFLPLQGHSPHLFHPLHRGVTELAPGTDPTLPRLAHSSEELLT